MKLKLANIPKLAFIPRGKYSGNTCIYIQFSGCNLKCMWKNSENGNSLCTQYEYSYLPICNIDFNVTIDQILNIINENKNITNKIFITGGEPFLQFVELLELIKTIKQITINSFIIVETNATMGFIDVLSNIDYLMISPKLSSSIPTKNKFDNEQNYLKMHELKHIYYIKCKKVLYSYTEYCALKNLDYEIDFIISNQSDESEIIIDYYPNIYRIDVKKIRITPLLNDKNAIKFAQSACIRNHWILELNSLNID